MLDFKKLYLCPFCGGIDKLNNFITINKNGNIRKNVKCPLCKESFRLKTLLSEMDYDKWGEWVYLNIRLFNSPRFKFYDKVHWDILWANLDLLGYAPKHQFLKGFHQHKGEATETMKTALRDLEKKTGITVEIKAKRKLESFFVSP